MCQNLIETVQFKRYGKTNPACKYPGLLSILRIVLESQSSWSLWSTTEISQTFSLQV